MTGEELLAKIEKRHHICDCQFCKKARDIIESKRDGFNPGRVSISPDLGVGDKAIISWHLKWDGK